jgi:hypothetical protein
MILLAMQTNLDQPPTGDYAETAGCAYHDNLRRSAAACLPAQVPATDARNTAIRHADFRFTMPKCGSLEEWKARRAQSKRQILLAAGVPLPEKTPLHAQVFGSRDPGRCGSGPRF